jgi:hypothetical protein
MSIVQPTISQSVIDEISTYINGYRASHHSPPIIWDATIAKYSQQWSYYLISNNLFHHSGTKLYGENLALFQGYGTDVISLFKNAIDQWYGEIKNYDFNNPGFSSSTGHFTCLVWKASTNFGMGISINSATNTVDITFNTSPPGNIDGKYQLNILPQIMPGPVPTPAPEPVPSPVPSPSPAPIPEPVPSPIPAPIPGPILNKQGYVTALNNAILAIRTNQPPANVINYLNNIINSLTAYQSTTNVINSLYNAIYLIQTKQQKNLVYNQLKNAIHYIYYL